MIEKTNDNMIKFHHEILVAESHSSSLMINCSFLCTHHGYAFLVILYGFSYLVMFHPSTFSYNFLLLSSFVARTYFILVEEIIRLLGVSGC
jgi:hypothetical protein